MAKALVVNPEKCIGCKSCVLACSFAKEQEYSLDGARLGVVWIRPLGLYVTVVCQQCEEPLCQEVCPQGAIHTREDGVKVVDQDRCIGCRACLAACPFGAPLFHSATGKMVKCDLCDGNPACVEVCPEQAITFEEISDTVRKKRREAARLLSVFTEKSA